MLTHPASKISGLWYHGDTSRRESFDDQKMDRDRGSQDLNACGPGIYLTHDEQQGWGYAWPSGWFNVLRIRPGARILSETAPPQKAIILKMIDLAPAESRYVGLTNYNFEEDTARARSQVADEYVRANETLLEALVALYHDMYGYQANPWTSAMVTVGFDATLHRLPEVDHLVVYNPKIIVRVSEEPYREERPVARPEARRLGGGSMTKRALQTPNTGKLVEILGPVRLNQDVAKADFDVLNQQEGSLGGGVDVHELGYLKAQKRGHRNEYHAVIFMVWPADAHMPVGTGVSTRRRAKLFGVKVPRGVDV